MDWKREKMKAAKAAAEQEHQLGGGLRAGVGASLDECTPQIYSPRLGTLRMIDEATDTLLSQVARLREFRKLIDRGSDRDASLVEEAIKILAPK